MKELTKKPNTLVISEDNNRSIRYFIVFTMFIGCYLYISEVAVAGVYSCNQGETSKLEAIDHLNGFSAGQDYLSLSKNLYDTSIIRLNSNKLLALNNFVKLFVYKELKRKKKIYIFNFSGSSPPLLF